MAEHWSDFFKLSTPTERESGGMAPTHGQKAKPCQAATFARGDFGQYFCLSRSFPIPRLRPIVDTNGQLNTS